MMLAEGHCFKLFKKRYRLDVGKFKFTSRVCEEWNRLGDQNCSLVVSLWPSGIDSRLERNRL